MLSKAEGNVDNSGFGNWLGGSGWLTPNTGAINSYGELTNSRRHEFKLYTSYLIPVADVLLGVSYTGTSGRPYTLYAQLSGRSLNVPGSSSRSQVYLLPRGSERNEFYHNVDLRAEKLFNFSGNRFGVYADVTNLFNRSGITSVNTRYPSTTIGGNRVLYQAPTGVQSARQVTLGARWTF